MKAVFVASMAQWGVTGGDVTAYLASSATPMAFGMIFTTHLLYLTFLLHLGQRGCAERTDRYTEMVITLSINEP
jgi:hypothetical protein